MEAYPEKDPDAGVEADDRVDIDTRDGLVDAGIFLGATDGTVPIRRNGDVADVHHGFQVQQVRQGECLLGRADVYYSDDSDSAEETNNKEGAVIEKLHPQRTESGEPTEFPSDSVEYKINEIIEEITKLWRAVQTVAGFDPDVVNRRKE